MYTAAALTTKNPVLLKGEVVYEESTGRHKVGDGVTAWNNLAYEAGGGGDIPKIIPVVGTDSTADFLGKSTTVTDALQKVIAAANVGRVRMALYEGIQCTVWYTDEAETIVGTIGFIHESSAIIYGTIAVDNFGGDIFDKTDEEIIIGVMNECDYFNPGSIPASHIATGSLYRFVSDTEKSAWNNKAAKDLANVTLTKLFSDNGYYKAPDGLMFQWGTRGGSSGGAYTIYFPTTFYAVPPIVIATPTSTDTAYNGSISCYVTGKTASYFSAILNWKEGNSQGRSGWPFYWLAIGRWK